MVTMVVGGGGVNLVDNEDSREGNGGVALFVKRGLGVKFC